MASVRCPRCGERVKVREDGDRLRCPECGKKFDLPDEDDEDEDDRPRPRPKRKPAKSSGTKLAAFIVGGVLLAAVIALVIVITVRKGGSDGGSVPVDSAKVTMENFHRLKAGMTLAEVEGILGGGRPSSEDDLRSAISKSRLDRDLDDLLGTEAALLDANPTWRRWEGKNLRVWIAFLETRDGPRAAYSVSLEPWHGGHKYESGFLWTDPRDLERIADAQKKDMTVRGDARWVRGEQARALLPGEWRDESGDGIEFRPDGRLVELSFHNVPYPQPPTFRLLDDARLETSHPSLFTPPPGQLQPFPNQGPTVRSYEYYVNNEELALIEAAPNPLAPETVRILYRMPASAGSLAERKLVAPLVADLKGRDAEKRQIAINKLQRLGKGVPTAVSALAEMVNGPDNAAALFAIASLGSLGEAARPAVPVLAAQLRNPTIERALAIMVTLRQLGPEAREALPTLRAILNNPNQWTLHGEARATIDFIEGRKR